MRTVSNVVTASASVAPQTRARVQRSSTSCSTGPTSPPATCAVAAPASSGWSSPSSTRPTSASSPRLLVDAAQSRSWTVLIDQTDGDADGERRLLRRRTGGQRRRRADHEPVGASRRPTSPDRHDVPPLVLLGEQAAAPGRPRDDRQRRRGARRDHAPARPRPRRIAAIGPSRSSHNGTAAQRLTGYRARRSPRPGLPPTRRSRCRSGACTATTGRRVDGRAAGAPAAPDARVLLHRPARPRRPAAAACGRPAGAGRPRGRRVRRHRGRPLRHAVADDDRAGQGSDRRARPAVPGRRLTAAATVAGPPDHVPHRWRSARAPGSADPPKGPRRGDHRFRERADSARPAAVPESDP